MAQAVKLLGRTSCSPPSTKELHGSMHIQAFPNVQKILKMTKFKNSNSQKYFFQEKFLSAWDVTLLLVISTV